METNGPSGRELTVSTVVMAHPSRAGMVTELLAQLDGPATVVWDEKNQEWDTARRSLLAYDPASDYVLVIQDDAVPCRDLLAGLAVALPYAPESAVVGLYVGGPLPRSGSLARAYRTAEDQQAPWVVATRLWWGVAVVYPVPIVAELVSRCDGIGVLEYDRRVSSWLRRRGIPVAYTVPSLVDHRPGPSLLTHDRPFNRAAHRWVGEVSALDVDWSAGSVAVPDPRAPAQQVRRISGRPTVRRR